MTSYKDTLLWESRIDHHQKLIRGDMIHILELTDQDRLQYFRDLAILDASRFADAWINAKEDVMVREEARDLIAAEFAKALEQYYQTYTMKGVSPMMPPSPEVFKMRAEMRGANSSFEPYGMHFQPYGYRESRSSGPDRERINNDWIAHSHPSYSVPDVSSSVCDSGSSGGDCS